MKYILLGVVVLACMTFQAYADGDIVVLATNDSVRVRAYDVVAFPALHPRFLSVRGVRVLRTQTERIVDVAQFIMTDYSQASVFFGYFKDIAHAPADAEKNLSSVDAAAFAFILRSLAVFEYNEGNGVNGFQNNTADNITGRYDLSSPFLPWKDITVSSQNISDSNGNTRVFFITMETQDEVFRMDFTIAGNPIRKGNVSLDPTTMKIDYTIQWFTEEHVAAEWTTGPSSATQYPNAQVGLFNVIACGGASTVVSRSGEDNSTGLGLKVGGYQSFFDWASDVEVDSVVKKGGVYHYSVSSDALNANITAGWEAQAIVFSFEGSRPAEVYWDPQMGAEIDYEMEDPDSESSMQNGSNILAPIFAVVVAIVTIIF